MVCAISIGRKIHIKVDTINDDFNMFIATVKL